MNTVRPVFTDTSVLLNLAFAGCLDLLRGLIGYEFLVPEEVLSEILGPREQGEVRVALQAGFLRRTTMADPGELAVFADLRQFLGIGESACLALASQRSGLLASDEKRRLLREAEDRLGPGRVLNTPGLFLLALRGGLMTIEEADAAKLVLERHRFRMRFSSFRDLF